MSIQKNESAIRSRAQAIQKSIECDASSSPLWALLLSVPAQAQFSSSVQGTVTDSSGAAVPNVPVTLTNPETNAQFHATTNGAGGYRFSSLAPGSYKIKVEATGFQPKEVEVKLSTEQVAGVDIPLAVGGATSSHGHH